MALLYHALSPFIVSPQYRAEFLDLIEATPEVQTLANVIADRVPVNPTALCDGDTQMVSALSAAVDSLLAPAVSCAALGSSLVPAAPNGASSC